MDPSHASSSSEPPRKRSRSEVTAEERKEARAHRNRIAAQNSRDRRKAQFSYLERRVAELEEEHHHAFEPDPASAVRRATPAEAVDVVAHRVWVDSRFVHSLLKHRRVMDALTAREDLFTTYKDVEGVGEPLS